MQRNYPLILGVILASWLCQVTPSTTQNRTPYAGFLLKPQEEKMWPRDPKSKRNHDPYAESVVYLETSAQKRPQAGYSLSTPPAPNKRILARSNAHDYNLPPPISTSSSSFLSSSGGVFDASKTIKRDYSMDKCSREQQNNSAKEQRDYINKYITLDYNEASENITIGFLSSFPNNKLALGALPIAVEAVNNDPTLLPGKRLLYEVADVGNSNLEALAALSIRRMTAMRDAGHLAFIGPDDNCANEALVAAAWNLPMITYKCADKRVSDKSKYYTFARTLPPSTKIVKALVSLMKKYDWKQFVLLTENTKNYLQIEEAVKSFSEHHGINITHQYSVAYNYTLGSYDTMEKYVKGSLHSTRIYVLLASQEVQWDFVSVLRWETKEQLKEYAIITIDDDKYNDTSNGFRVPGKYHGVFNITGNLEVLYESFRIVVKITPAYPSNEIYKEFEKQVLSRIKQYPFCVPYNPELFPFIEVPIFAAHLYDAVMIYANALNQTLADPNADPANGTHILSLIKNKAFPSIQGFKIYIDENGDAEGSYSLLAIRKIASSSTPSMSWHKVGEFLFHDKNHVPNAMENLPSLTINEDIYWLGGAPPKDSPKCGFNFEKCDQQWHSTVVVISVSFLLVAVILFFLFRHYRYEHRLACLLWKIDMREVKVINTEIPSFGQTKNNTIQVYRQSLFAGGGNETLSDTPRLSYCKMGLYKGNIIAIKHIEKRSVDLTRSIRKELKQMREVRHENLLPFIGASVDTGCVCILTAYCARGSLEDVLQNDDLQLDNMFVASLVADLIKGMIYLHDSEIISHGNLRSANCLIDSRWVLQVADFGLHEFKATSEMVCDSRKKLWRAPELLRVPGAHPRGTQKGDVYSFGIILYEVVGRKGPWGSLLNQYNMRELLCGVASGMDPPLRPPLDTLKAPEYVQRCLRECWAEDPDERPDFKLVRVRLKEMQAGLKLNIVDNMLAIMEKYAYNLEGKVQERTKQLMEEKKKTEILLLRMLPKSVAESLKRGEKVPPESYDNVTIYFSDIVGFTALSAESTPLQMVDMLNELYTCFDAIIGDYDVYKVETIGDAYMVVSGLPISNGDQHAAEIASMALKLLLAVKKFTIRHRPGDTLKLRIGIHSGPCVAGVVGLTMPRYCLFGDTVNTASRMESTGAALRIHISEANKLMLDRLGGYAVEERGMTYVKGKGHMRTWWLTGEHKEGVKTRRSLPQENGDTTPTCCTSPSNIFFNQSSSTCPSPTATSSLPSSLHNHISSHKTSPISCSSPVIPPYPAPSQSLNKIISNIPSQIVNSCPSHFSSVPSPTSQYSPNNCQSPTESLSKTNHYTNLSNIPMLSKSNSATLKNSPTGQNCISLQNQCLISKNNFPYQPNPVTTHIHHYSETSKKSNSSPIAQSTNIFAFQSTSPTTKPNNFVYKPPSPNTNARKESKSDGQERQISSPSSCNSITSSCVDNPTTVAETATSITSSFTGSIGTINEQKEITPESNTSSFSPQSKQQM
ncbi:guanylate cyclase 32E isoform X2 [Palaemon carinicauda]|uniref:guanylate cyclase 32E isoform X2 n=1 Tax=Palaemon carinicauda TaxID=392227 RepID=UPI0035B60A6F